MPFGLSPAPGPNTRRRRRNQVLLWGGSALLAIILSATINGWASHWGIPVIAQQGAVALVAIALMGLTVLHWRSLDEIGRQLHASAFFWSGMVSWTGVLVVIGVAAAGQSGEGPLFPAFGSAFLVIGAHAVLYVMLYAALWLRTRLP